MKIIVQSFLSIFKSVLVISGCLILLSACGESASKTDLLKIAKVLYDSDLYSEKEKHLALQKRLKEVKSEAEAHQVLSEIVADFEPIPAKLDALNLKTSEAKSIRDKFSKGLRGVAETTRAFMNLSMPQDAEKFPQLREQLFEHQKMLQEAVQEFEALAAKEGLNIKKMRE